MTDEIKKIRISTIKIPEQFRKDMGDLEELAESIRGGLLQPIGITPKRELVFGFRRLTACRDVLGWKTIPARTVDVPSIFEGMLTENMVRKDFSVSERVAIFKTIKKEIGSRKGHRTDLRLGENFPEVKPGQRTDDFASKRAGLGNRKTAAMAENAVKAGGSKLVEAMDKGEMSISAAAEIVGLPRRDQKKVLEKGCDQTRLTAQHVRKYRRLRHIEEQQEKERQAILQTSRKKRWTLTASQKVVPCDLLVTDPPQGILPSVEWDNPPEGIEAFTRNWCKRWAKCGANYIAIFWNQTTKWEAKRWLDESLEGYEFLQECCCHRNNCKKPQGINGTHKQFRYSWEPVFIYRRKGFDRDITSSNHALGNDLTDIDHHSASYPTAVNNGHRFREHDCQKPVSAMRWLVHGLTVPGEKVVDPFCGSASSGIAAVQLGRKFYGIEIDKESRAIAQGRLAAFGKPERSSNGKIRKPRANSVTQGNCMDLIPLLDDRSVNLCLCSPPYGDQRNGHYEGVTEGQYPEFTLRWMSALWDKLSDDGSVLIVIRPDLKRGVVRDYVLRTRLTLRDFGWKECETLLWYKPDGGCCLGSNHRPRRTYEQILWFAKTNDPFIDVKACGHWSEDISFRWTTRFAAGGNSPVSQSQNFEKRPGQTRLADVITVPVGKIDNGIQHPAMFPTELADILIKTFCPAKGTVLDNFCGSGSTLLPAKQLGRTYQGFDLEKEYVQIARKRLAQNGKGARKKSRAG
jgi:DNA modification methylase